MNSLFLRAVLLTLVSLAVACSSAVTREQDRSANQAAQEELVWSELLSTIAGDRYQLVVVQDSAELLVPDAHDRQLMLEQLTDLREETVESFARANTVPRALPDFTSIGIAVEHAGAADLATFRGAADPDEYWRRFYARYPDSPGLVRLSRVGFDQVHEQSLVFVYAICGGRCGTGRYVLLSRSGGQWEVVGDHGVFVH
jgi:hypothetical protein